ncbi:hypothetical protein [Sphaerisporangium fuscum]|uniref:hypothetical protein n=1 Tax=Sphaerisporangium fuscum TaxID=2835868 RepID=UPI001BDBB97B|nr:hypothetical protein [Sphaerisporangium fuscum]
MRNASRVLLGLATAAVLGLGLPAAASASTAKAADKWSWGPTASSDTKGWAGGEIRTTRSGLRISGDLYDAGGARTCSWLKIKWLTDKGKYRTATFKNCDQVTPRSFHVNAGYMISSEAKVCRGTSTRITGKCSHWEGVWAQGG